MIKYLFLIIFLLFTFKKWNIYAFPDPCSSNMSIYEPYEKNNLDNFDCIICYCTKTNLHVCQQISLCSEMKCEKNYIYERDCCKYLKCKGILINKEQKPNNSHVKVGIIFGIILLIIVVIGFIFFIRKIFHKKIITRTIPPKIPGYGLIFQRYSRIP